MFCRSFKGNQPAPGHVCKSRERERVSRKIAGRKMAVKARAIFIFLPAIFLL
jgi:hypothetical protein